MRKLLSLSSVIDAEQHSQPETTASAPDSLRIAATTGSSPDLGFVLEVQSIEIHCLQPGLVNSALLTAIGCLMQKCEIIPH